MNKQVLTNTNLASFEIVPECKLAPYEHCHYWDSYLEAFVCPKAAGSVRGEPL
jgi:hypothetical protein